MSFFDYVFSKKTQSTTETCTFSEVEKPSENYPFSEEFNAKILDFTRYYLTEPSINKDGLLEDINQYLTTEDIGILVDLTLKKNRKEKIKQIKLGDNASVQLFDTKNVKLIEDNAEFEKMQQYLTEHPLQKVGDNIKLLLKIKKFEPTNYGKSYGVHTVPVYLRFCKDLNTNNEEVRVFIYDAASGLLSDVRDGFHNLTNTLHKVLTQQGLPHKIIKTSNLVQDDTFTCPIHAIQALKYFIKYGHRLFTEIMPNLVPQKEKICDLNKSYVYHLRMDALPAQLLALTNRNTVKRVRIGYKHAWLWSAGQIKIKRAYYARRNLLISSSHKFINKKRTLNQVLNDNSIAKTSSRGVVYQHNNLPWEKFLLYRQKIVHTLAKMGEINIEKKCLELNYSALQDNLKHVIMR